MEDLIKSLVGLGYSEEQANSIVTHSSKSKKVYFQSDVDNITSMVKENSTKNYVPKIDYDMLSKELKEAKVSLKTNAIKEVYLKQGGNEEYFQDFIKARGEILESEDINKAVGEAAKNTKWAFGTSHSLQDYGIKEPKGEEPSNFEDTIYTVNWAEKIKEK